MNQARGSFRPHRQALSLAMAVMALGVLVPHAAHTQTGRGDTIQGVLSSEVYPFAQGIPQARQSVDTLQVRILEEARTFLSGMIHGFSFVYVPSDQARNIAEVFDITPRGLIQGRRGALRLIESQEVDNRFELRLAYLPDASEARARSLWLSSSLPSAEGSGSADLFTVDNAKYQAFLASCREAIRNHARIVSPNKPDEIRGRFALSEFPRIFIRSGQYVSQVRIRLKIEEIDAYRTW